MEVLVASVRYLPAYSPDLNPIEQASAELSGELLVGLDSTRASPPPADRTTHYILILLSSRGHWAAPSALVMLMRITRQ
jgi:transposase